MPLAGNVGREGESAAPYAGVESPEGFFFGRGGMGEVESAGCRGWEGGIGAGVAHYEYAESEKAGELSVW